ncbi:MAG: hypothetical protein ACXWAC_17440 [Usitatibacter sp.]
MKEKIRYTDEPMNVGPIIPNFLPPPDRLVLKEDSVKVTISLSAKSVLFFKSEASKRGVQYQRMIRRLLDAYVEAFEEPAERALPSAKSPRAEQGTPRYRKAAKRR